jgi:hypothetical protein
MIKFKNLVCNIPIYMGVILRHISNATIVLGLRLHITLKTDAGKNLKKYQDELKLVANELQKSTGNTKTVSQIKTVDRSSKLADIIKGSNNGSSNN